METQLAVSQGTEQSSTANKSQSAVSDDPLDRINLLLDQAEQGNQSLISIRGYNIKRELGRGNMGAVYLAVHNQKQETVALKVMLPKVERDPKSHQMFIRETKNTKLLNHPNIVCIHDVGYSEETFFFTTDFCEAGSVADLIKQHGGKLPVFTAVKLLLQVLDGLQYAHTVEIPSIVLADGSQKKGVGLVHRDLKPGNILLTQDNSNELRAKIADFGLAKAFDTAGLSGRTATGISAGTPFYMPRQQVINFKFAKPEVDVWAAAATFYKMVTGRHARHFSKETDPWLTTLKTAAIPIQKREPSISPALASVIDKALIDQPEIPFKSAIQFKEELLKVI